MKLYRYYLVNKHEREYPLYAWTDDKSIATLFKKYRDMSVLKESIIEIKKSEYHQTVNNFSDQVISIGEFRTINPVTQLPTRIKIPTTWDEQKIVAFSMDNIVLDMTKSVEELYPEIFNETIQEALFQLGYFMFYQWLYQNMYIYTPLHHKFDNLVHDDIIKEMKECVSYDEYEVLMKLRGNTFKKYKDLEEE